MLAEPAKNLVPKFFDDTGTTYDGVVSYGTLGKDRYWKSKILEQISDGILSWILHVVLAFLPGKSPKNFPAERLLALTSPKVIWMWQSKIQIHLITSRLFLTTRKNSNWIQSLTVSPDPICQSTVTRKYL